MMACSILLGGCQDSPQPDTPRIVKGTLDLRNWQPSAIDQVLLDGEWEFLPGHLITAQKPFADNPWPLRKVPDLWNGTEAAGLAGQGFGTYRLRILLPPSHETLALRLLTVSTACEIEANGQLIYQAGKPAAIPSMATARFRPGIAELPEAGDQMEILVRVSNWDYRSGGMWRAFSLGLYESMENAHQRAGFLAIFLGAALLATSLNSLLIFMFRPAESSYLWFSAFVMSMAVRTMLTGEYLLAQLVPWLPFDLLIRLEYVTVFLNLPVCAMFFLTFFPGIGGSLDRKLLVLPSLGFILLTVILPLPILTRVLAIYYPLGLASLVWLFWRVLIPAAKQKIQGSHLLLSGAIGLCLTAINDAMFASFLIQTGNLMPFGLVVFISLQGIVMAQRFTGAFNRTEDLTTELAKSNNRLNDELDERSHIQANLVNLLSEKNLLIKEIHHRVKNSLQIVSSIIGLQSNRERDPNILELMASLRMRIRAISLVHEKLYAQAAVTEVDLGGYIRDLVHLFVSGFGTIKRNIVLEPFAIKLNAPVEFCIDLGLVLTELVTNSLKHNQQTLGHNIEVIISLSYLDGIFECHIRDNGPGFPPGLDVLQSNTLGYRMVYRLLDRSKGRLSINPGPGAHVVLKIPLPDCGDGEVRPSPALEGPFDVISED